MTIIAAIDDSAVAGPVLATAKRLAALFGTRIEAVHVRTGGSGGARAAAIADVAGVNLRLLDGDIVERLGLEVRERDAAALVIGSREQSDGAIPAGHIALDVVRSLECTIVVVPPGAPERPLRRVLVAVEGDGQSAALRRLFDHLGDRPIPEVIALHVIASAALPPFADSPVLETDAFERELKLRAASDVGADPSDLRFEIRVGDAPGSLREAIHELDVDLVVLAWHRDLSGGHGRLVREMLERGSTPVALLGLGDRAQTRRA